MNSYDEKLSLSNNDKDDLLNKLNKIGQDKNYDISDVYKLLKDFEPNDLTQDKKKDYYILQHSFILTHNDNNSLFVCNRNPIGYDGDSERITKGLSVLLSASNIEKKYDSFDFICDTIKNKIFFNKKQVNVKIKFLGFGYNNIPNKAKYIFLVYQVDLIDNIFDALLINEKKDNIDADYIFQVDKSFLSSEIGINSFINKNAHFDNSVISSFRETSRETSKHKFTFGKASFYRASNAVEQDKKIEYGSKNIEKFKSLLIEIFNNIKKDKIGLGEEVFNLVSSEDKSEAMYEIIKCFFKVPIGIIKLS